MFKNDFKYYKSKKPLPDLSNVLNFNNTPSIQNKVRSIMCENSGNNSLCGLLKSVDQWEAYELIDNPGLIFIRNPFTSHGQRYWTVRCLQDYTKRPNKLNLDIHGLISDNQNWWDACQTNENKTIMEKLRWATLGYHHNWDTKVYSEDLKNDFPADLAQLSKYMAGALGYKYFNAEAAIVNYYHMDSTLSGHTDHSEQNLEAPLFSFSFGQSAIFLLGGTTLDIKPTAMFLHSGDVVVMSKESRLSYHGVPRIIHAAETPWNEDETEEYNINSFSAFCNVTIAKCEDENFWRPFGDYLKHSRININVRQVLEEQQTCLTVS